MKGRQQVWFATRLLFEAVDVETERPRTWEDRLLLIRARTSEEAVDKAMRKGRESEHEYVAAEGNRVRWRFRTIGDVQPVLDERIEDGTEVYSSYIDLTRAAPLWDMQPQALSSLKTVT
jgi:hypothetical protein